MIELIANGFVFGRVDGRRTVRIAVVEDKYSIVVQKHAIDKRIEEFVFSLVAFVLFTSKIVQKSPHRFVG